MSQTAINKTDEQWRKELTPQQYHVLREKGTDPAFRNAYFDTDTPGQYVCAGCGQALFSSDAKFHSGTGWPSFTAPIEEGRVHTQPDDSLAVARTEAVCSRCGGHLGHVFEDGPAPTGQRYCMNSTSLKLVEKT